MTPGGVAALVAGGGFAITFGFVGAKANFCTLGALSDIVNTGHGGRVRMWLLAAVFAAALPAVGAAQDFMTQEQLLATIPGSTIHAKTNEGVPWAQAYSAYKGGKKKGVISVNFNGEKSTSKWSVKGNQWCEDWGSGHACWDVEQVDAKSLRMYENGKPKKNLWKIQ